MKVKVKIIQDIPVSYLPPNPFNKKIETGPSEVYNLTPEHIKAIDKIVNPPLERDERGRFKPRKQVLPKEVKEQWNKIKGKNHIYAFYFKKGFRHPKVKGRLIYAFTFWPLSDIVTMAGRRREMHGFFLDPPWGAHIPPPRKDWVDQKLIEAKDAGKINTIEDGKKLKRELMRAYKRMVDKRKWINVIWVPTKTNSGIGNVYEAFNGIQTEIGVMVGIRREVADKLVHFETYKQIAEGSQEIDKRRTRLIHDLSDDIRKIAMERDEAKRHEKLKEVAFKVHSIYKGLPTLPSRSPSFTPPAKHSLTREVSTETVFMAVGFTMLVVGFIFFALNPLAIGFSVIGALLAITAYWKKRGVPEVLTEKAEEVSEELKQS